MVFIFSIYLSLFFLYSTISIYYIETKCKVNYKRQKTENKTKQNYMKSLDNKSLLNIYHCPHVLMELGLGLWSHQVAAAAIRPGTGLRKKRGCRSQWPHFPGL